MKAIKQDFGDGGTLKVVLYRADGKRYYIQVYANGRVFERRAFNRKDTALKHYNKVVREF